MSFKALPMWGKLLIGGGSATVVGAFSAWMGPRVVEAYKINTDQGVAPKYFRELAENGLKTLQKADGCQSLLKKHLTSDVLSACNHKKTMLGATLWDCIQSGVKNLDSSVGIYACDADSYSVFKQIFDPIIRDYHGLGSRNAQPAVDFGENKLDYFKDLDPKGKFIQSTRIRCARTVEGWPMNPNLREDDYYIVERLIKDGLENFHDNELRGTYYPLKGMTKDTQKQLIADHFLFKEGDRYLQEAQACRFWPAGRGIYHNKDKTFLVWVNEEDHMRIISMQNGGNVGQVMDRLVRALKELESRPKLKFARDARLGYLTFCPSNLGTTIRASVHIKLPKISARKDFKELCESMNLQIRGIHGEHSESKGGVFDISNKQRMGVTEFEAVKQMYDGVKKLIDMEESA